MVLVLPPKAWGKPCEPIRYSQFDKTTLSYIDGVDKAKKAVLEINAAGVKLQSNTDRFRYDCESRSSRRAVGL